IGVLLGCVKLGIIGKRRALVPTQSVIHYSRIESSQSVIPESRFLSVIPESGFLSVIPESGFRSVIPESREARVLESRFKERPWIPELASQLWNDGVEVWNLLRNSGMTNLRGRFPAGSAGPSLG
ncbi:MAG TPA: hypothetical protein VJN01_00115, partial [Xanthomonadales bacterium]|nr:hypothetical protein [Xanthomonadales bacterium]